MLEYIQTTGLIEMIHFSAADSAAAEALRPFNHQGTVLTLSSMLTRWMGLYRLLQQLNRTFPTLTLAPLLVETLTTGVSILYLPMY